jgi:hypothetical protein
MMRTLIEDEKSVSLLSFPTSDSLQAQKESNENVRGVKGAISGIFL